MDYTLPFLFLLFLFALALCFLFGLLQYGAMRLKRALPRRIFASIQPLLWGGTLLLSIFQLQHITGWDQLPWQALQLLSAWALLCVLVGGALGLLRGRKR